MALLFQGMGCTGLCMVKVTLGEYYRKMPRSDLFALSTGLQSSCILLLIRWKIELQKLNY